MAVLFSLLAVALGLIVGAWAAAAVLRAEHAQDLAEREQRWAEQVTAIRRDAADRSRHTIKGQISEQIAPLLPSFPYEVSDARFLGSPIDYIVFSGYKAVQAKESDLIDEIVFVEVKRGRSDLSRIERRVRNCIREKRVRWDLVRIPDDLETQVSVPDAGA